MLELRHLRSLLAIHQSGSLSNAATRLHLTQSALSHQIKALEEYYGTALFLRSTKPLRLTPVGLMLMELAQQVLPAIDNADQQLRQFAQGTQGRLFIAIECHACFEWLVPVLDQYRQQWPDVELDIRPGYNFESIEALQKGEVDVVISSDPRDNQALYFEPLFDYEALLALAHDHPLAEKNYISPIDLADQILVTYPVERRRLDVFSRFLQPANVEPVEVRQAELTSVILLLVATLKGVAVLPDWVLRESLNQERFTTRPLGEQGMRGSMFAAVREQDRNLPYIQKFVALCRDAMNIG